MTRQVGNASGWKRKEKKNVKKKWKGPGALWAMLDGLTWAYFQKNGLGLTGMDLRGAKGRNEQWSPAVLL